MIIPSKRSLIEVKAGHIDGETARVGDLDNKNYPNLVKIPVVICYQELNLYATQNIQLTSLDDLNNYKLAIIRGHVLANEQFGKYSPLLVNSNEQLIELLIKQRIDIIAISD